VIVAEMTLRGLARRRGTLALLVALPLLFYVARHSLAGQSVRFLAIGLAWAISTLALFAALAARDTEPRLRVGGWSWRALLAGRVAGLLAIALALAVAYFALVAADRQVDRVLAVGVMLVVTAATAVAAGTALGAVARREQDGALLLFIVAGLQFIADPPTLLAHLLPYWSTRELGTWAIDGTVAPGPALAHAAATIALCAAITVAWTPRRAPAGRRAPRARPS
jgi:hypothetical protein